jgi:hypothetical protein
MRSPRDQDALADASIEHWSGMLVEALGHQAACALSERMLSQARPDTMDHEYWTRIADRLESLTPTPSRNRSIVGRVYSPPDDSRVPMVFGAMGPDVAAARRARQKRHEDRTAAHTGLSIENVRETRRLVREHGRECAGEILRDRATLQRPGGR